MKKVKIIAVIVLAAILLLSFAGCSKSIDWDKLKRDDVVAEYNGVQLKKNMVQFEQVMQEYSAQYTASFYEQLGGDGEYDGSVSMDDCLISMAAYLAVAGIAKDEGLYLDEETAREGAYDEYILSAKKHDQLKEFSDNIKTKLYLSDDLLVDYATQYSLITDSAEEVVKKEFDSRKAEDYEDLDAMTEDVLKTVQERVKGIKVTVLVPDQHTVDASTLDYSSVVSGVKWSYSSLFQ